MIEYVFGAKGSGKTKKMIDMANDVLKTAKGTVLFINDRDKYRATVNNQIRFINTEEYGIKGIQEFFGFVCGVIASNYDVEYVYIDNTLRILDAKDPEDLQGFVDLLDSVKTTDANFVLSVSLDESEAPENLK